MMAPPSRPAATPAATPRCALAGVAASEPAIVATATKAAKVFFMSWALLGWRPQAPGLEVTHTLISNCRFAKKAHMGQSKVNVPVLDGKKKVFSGHKQSTPRKSSGFPGCWVRFNEGERRQRF